MRRDGEAHVHAGVVLELRHITKTFGPVRALTDVDATTPTASVASCDVYKISSVYTACLSLVSARRDP